MRTNKGIYALAISLAMLVANDAFASRARLLVLGTGDQSFLAGSGNGGSLYINDMYNIFYNPAYVSDYKDMAIIEKSNGTSGAEGGFITSMSGISFGAYFNRQTGIAAMLNRASMKPVDLYVGGDHGVKWGFGFTYGDYKKRTSMMDNGTLKLKEASDTDMTARFGVSTRGFDPFFSVKLRGNQSSNVVDPAIAGNTGTGRTFQEWTAGMKYTYGEWIPYAAFRSHKEGVANVNKDVKTWGLGFGRTIKGTESVNVNYGLSFWRVDQVRSVVPVEVSIEGKATSWLTLRGGMRHHVWDRNQQIDNVTATTGRLGASLNFGRIDLDWAVGNAATNTENVDSATFDFSNSLFTAASLSYRW